MKKLKVIKIVKGEMWLPAEKECVYVFFLWQQQLDLVYGQYIHLKTGGHDVTHTKCDVFPHWEVLKFVWLESWCGLKEQIYCEHTHTLLQHPSKPDMSFQCILLNIYSCLAILHICTPTSILVRKVRGHLLMNSAEHAISMVIMGSPG